MENINNKANTNLFKRFFIRLKNGYNKIFNNKLYAFLLLTTICVGILVLVISYTSYLGGIMNISSDDILQYYPYVDGFFDNIKDGSVSLYEKNLLIGTSWFSGAYYIPLDIFTLVAFLLSFIIPNEVAYSITNLGHVLCGALLFYYVLVRHHSIKVSFLASLILLVTGMTEAYYIFPIYLGIIFYAPLAMLLIDIVIEKKGKWFLFIPLYILQVVLFDFYIAYMLIAFLCFYLVIKMHIENYFSFSPKEKNFIFANKEFWRDFIKFMLYVFLGVIISMFFLLPSALYILTESNRSDNETKESMLYFCQGKYNDNLYYAHYFLQLINIYIPNEPHAFCLEPAGAYIREHASLYITSGALIYFVYFFTIRKDSKINRLKFWVILFNIMFMIPIFSKLLGLNSYPYVRWFFIPLMFNLYASILAMNHNNFKFGNKNYIKLIPIFILMIGVSLIIYVYKTDTPLFLHYSKGTDSFKMVLIPALVINISFMLILLSSFILEELNKHYEIVIKLIPILTITEVVIAFAVVFSNMDNSSSTYSYRKDVIKSQLKELDNIYNYDEADGFRINMYTKEARNQQNAGIFYGVNYGKFFQSFYNSNINVLMRDIYGDTDTDWSRTMTYGYSLVTGPLFNIKYVISSDNIHLPLDYYTLYSRTVDDKKEYYYEVKNAEPFIVYDKAFTETSNLPNYFERQLALLNYAYIKVPNGNETYIDKKYYDTYYDNYNYLYNNEFKFYSSNDVMNSIKPHLVGSYTDEYSGGSYKKYNTAFKLSGAETKENSSYYYYNLNGYEDNGYYYIKDMINRADAINVYPDRVKDRQLTDGWMYLKNDDIPGAFIQGHYNNIYIDHKYDDYKTISVYSSDTKSSSGCTVIGYKYSIYDEFIAKQSEYRNKKYRFKGTKMDISFEMDSHDTPVIIKTAYAYSDSFKVNKKGYKTICVDGSFLGIVVPKNTTNVNIEVNYDTPGLKYGIIVSSIGIVAYIGLCSPIVINYIKKRKKKRV